LARMATRPVYLLRRIAYRVYEWRHPGEPWISQRAVAFCDRALRPTMRGVETGSGRSSAWFAARLGHLTSVEHDEAWYGLVREKLQTFSNVDYRFVPLDHPSEAPTRPIYDPLPRYVAVIAEFEDESLDLVIVDGHYRQACIRAAIPKLKPGGWLLVDNTNWLADAEWGVPSTWPLVHRSSNVMTETSIWQKA
jgi:hypothetical protein